MAHDIEGMQFPILDQERVLTEQEQQQLNEDLFLFIFSNKIEKIQKAIQACPGIDLNKPVAQGPTLLTYAVGQDLPDIVRILCENGANPNIPDGRGWTPATLAVGRDKPHLLRLLKGRGADLDQADLQNTPLTLAVRYNKIDMVRLLCELGVDLDKPDGTNRTPLSAAGEADKLEMIRLLYDLHASIDAKDGDGMTALASGVYYSKPSAVRLLLSLGANPNVLVTNSPVSPLGIALLHNRHDVCQTLRAYGANDAEGTSLAQMKRVALVWGLTGSVFHEDVNGTIHRGTLEGSMVGSLPGYCRDLQTYFLKEARVEGCWIQKRRPSGTR